jgi:hypothetical protein
MGRLSKQMDEVIATSQITDASDSVWGKEEKNQEDAD